MAKQIKNRREDLYISNIPPEIPDGIVTNTDYASTDTAGVVKVSSSLGSAVSTSGVLQGYTRTLTAYTSGSQALLISKGTLENVIAALITKMFAAEADPSGEAEDGTRWDFSLYKQTAEGGGSEYIWLVEQHLTP